MKRKTNLKKRAAADHKRILEKNEGFLYYILEKNYSSLGDGTAVLYPGLWKKLVAIVTVIIIAVVATILCVTLLNANSDDLNKDKQYLQENIETNIVNVSDLYQEMKSVSVRFEENEIMKVELRYDSLSGDKLFYTVNGTEESGFYDWIVQIEVNANYHLPKNREPYTEMASINNMAVHYWIESETDDGLVIITTYAYIEYEFENVYIEYTCITEDIGDNSFFEWLRNAIVLK